MPEARVLLNTIHTLFVLALPVAVAAFGLSVLTALLLVLLAITWRWLIVLAGLLRPAHSPSLVLESIQASHFVEKVRWCLDRLGLDYREETWGGTLGAFYLGRTVPRLKFVTGRVRSSIGNSSEILRYLWGAYGSGQDNGGRFLEPRPERVELERRLDRYGVDLQVWVYSVLEGERELTLRAWGAFSAAVPSWQRLVLKLVYPVQARLVRRSFGVGREGYAKAVERIEHLLDEIDTRLADRRASILGDDRPNYTDYCFAAMCGLWLQPEAFAAGRAADVRIERSQMPERMRADVERWATDYPNAVSFVDRLYRNERSAVFTAGPAEA